MAIRPIFIPTVEGRKLYYEENFSFTWSSGFAESQKAKNIKALHEAARRAGIGPILEVSTKSVMEVGRKLSAFNLIINLDGHKRTVETVFQSSKIFENGGPFLDLLNGSSLEAKRDPRLRNSGDLKGFLHQGVEYPLSPKSAFYDWIYVNALYPHREWLIRLNEAKGFSDIEFNPQKSINCQARSCAIFMSLLNRNQLDDALSSFEKFSDLAHGTTL